MNHNKRLTLNLILGLCGVLALISGKPQLSNEILPAPPDYSNPVMWITQDGDPEGKGADIFYVVSTWEKDWTDEQGHTIHYADVWNPNHRERMSREINKAAAYMSPGNRFYAPFYRHTTIETFVTRSDSVVYRRTRPSMKDVCDAFDHFLKQREPGRPLIIAGFSQGGLAVVELLKHMADSTYNQLAAAYVMGYKVTEKDTAACSHIQPAQGAEDVGVTICYNTVKDIKYIIPVLSASCLGINPVNWVTDATPATLHDTITVTLSPEHHVVVVDGYDGAEYRPFADFINVGDIHSCEPWLYSESIKENMDLRARKWREQQISKLVDSLWTFSLSRPDGFTLQLANWTEPTEGISVAYELTQSSVDMAGLKYVISHAQEHNGFVGGWLNSTDSLYYFDSVRIFPKDSLEAAIQFGKDNRQIAIYNLSTGKEIRLVED